MKCLPAVCCFFVIVTAISTTLGQVPDAARLRALREKARVGTLSSEEKAELDRAMKPRAQVARRHLPVARPPTATAGRYILNARLSRWSG